MAHAPTAEVPASYTATVGSQPGELPIVAAFLARHAASSATDAGAPKRSAGGQPLRNA